MNGESMMKRIGNKFIAVSLVVSLTAILLAQTIYPGSSAPATVDNSYGGNMWKDPCTLDGFAVGYGIVAQQWFVATLGLLRAFKVDNCFK